MSLRALLYAYVLGGLTFVPLLIAACIAFTLYTSLPAPPREPGANKPPPSPLQDSPAADLPRTRKGWLLVRRTFQESASDASYVSLVRSYLDSRSKDPKKSRPKDTWYVVLKGTVMYLYEDEAMSECEAAVELGAHDVVVYPEGLLDGELFTRRNAICLKPRPNVVPPDGDAESRDRSPEDPVPAPWFIFVRSCTDMEDWYLALVHASVHPSGTPTLGPLKPVFSPSDMDHLVATLDEQPDVIPMRWFNALLGRVFYSFYRTQTLESYIIGRLMKKLSKVKRPAFLTDIAVTQFSVGDKAPTFSKPMLKELTREGDASMEVALLYKGEIRATVEATAVINLGAHFKSYTVKLVLAVVLREMEGNLLIKVKRPPSSRIWYAFTKPPRMVVNVEPIVSDRQITWSMILNTIESKIEEIIFDSVVLPNMDDISFFDSAEHEHRGGIWADAGRRDPPPTPHVVIKPGLLVVPSEEAIHDEELAPETPSVDTIPAVRSAPTLTTARRRSAFSGAEDDVHTKEVDEDATLAGPSSPDTLPLDASNMVQDDQEGLGPRPSSAHSLESHAASRSSRAYSVSSSAAGEESFHYLSDASTTSNKSPRQSLGTSTTSSFLSTLKSKAGDKQALGNTAREAMRKWGVWGLKKDGGGGNPSLDEYLDVASSDHRARTEGTHGRPGYADMRAAVIERRERERINGSTSPISIPQGGGREKARSPSLSAGSSSGLSRSLGDGASNDAFKDRELAEVVEEGPAPSLIHTQPPQGRTMTIPGIHASHRGEVMSMGNVAPATESKTRGATIQSMYRLWKSPILTGQASQDVQPSSSSLPEGDPDVAPLSLTPEMTCPPARPVPPPLPPRAISSTAIRQGAETTDDTPVSAASPRDETQRVSSEGESGAPEVSSTAIPATKPPPLPPRRIPA